MAANEGSAYTNFSNVAIGTANGGGSLLIAGRNASPTPTTLSDASLTLTQAAHAGKDIILTIAATQTITLPAATGTGDRYRIVVGVTATGDKVIQVANATDEFAGVVYQVDTDTGDALVAYPAVDADGYDTVTLNGSTTGGLAGDVIEIIDAAAGRFAIVGHTNATGVVATPLSAAVA